MIDSDDFIFHTRLFPFAIPYKLEFTINSGTSLTANQEKFVYSDWETIVGSKLGWQTIYSVASDSQLDYLEYTLKSSGSTLQVTGIPSIEVSGDQVRGVLRLFNYTASTQTFTARDFGYEVFMYQLNNT